MLFVFVSLCLPEVNASITANERVSYKKDKRFSVPVEITV